MKTRLALLLLTSLVAGCAAPQVVRESSSSVQLQGLYSYGIGGRDLLLRIHGAPFPGAEAALEQAASQELSKGGLMQPLPHVTTHPDASAKPGYILVLDFADQPLADPCAPITDQTATTTHAPVVVEASLCISGRPLVQVRGSVAAQSPQDESFREMLRLVGSEIFRPEEYQGGNGDVSH